MSPSSRSDVTDSEAMVRDLSIAYESGRFVKRDIPKDC